MADPTTIFPPSGLDRADGTGNFPGTLTPPNSIQRQIATRFGGIPGAYFEEMPDSPKWNFGEQGTVSHTYECDEETFIQLIPLMQRGQLQLDSFDDLSKILESSAEYIKGNRYRINIVSEGLNWGIPPDEFSVEPMEINPDLMKHPRYNYGPAGSLDGDEFGLTAQQKAALRFVINQGNNYSANSAYNVLFAAGGIAGPGGTIDFSPIQQRMGWEIIQKYFRGEDTFYLPALVVTYSSFYYNPQPLCPGGFIDNPIFTRFGPSIPYFFWSRNGTDNPGAFNNILQTIAEGDSWNLWQNGVTYLRKADTFQYTRTWFKLTQTWIGAPTGPKDTNGQNYIYWDPDLYQNPPPALGNLPPASKFS